MLYLLLLVASAQKADIANLKPSTFPIVTCVKPGEPGGQKVRGWFGKLRLAGEREPQAGDLDKKINKRRGG